MLVAPLRSSTATPSKAGPDDRVRPSSRVLARPVAFAAMVSVLIRLRMYWTPVTSDEAGFLVIARSWAHGRILYRDVWVDRPQGLIILYRFWDWASGGSVASLRIMAMAFGVGLVVAVASVATQIAGRSSGAIAAFLVAVTSANPAIEGHLANGELLGGTVAVAGLAIGVRALISERPRLLLLSGIVGGVALTLKQNSFEGLGALFVWLAIAPRLGWRTRRASHRDMAALGAGALMVAAVAALHGSTFGWSRWWYAVVTHRFDERSAVSGPTFGRLWTTFLVAGPILLPLVMTCALAWFIRRAPNTPIRTSIRVPSLVGIWSGVVACSFLLGGNFFRHYWLSWCAVLSVAAGVALARLMTRRVATFAALTFAVPGLLAAAAILQLGRLDSGATASDDPRLRIDEPMAAWFHSVRRPGDRMYAMCASPGFYADAAIDPPVPYIWRDHVHMYPGAIDVISAMLLDTTRPRYLAMYQTTLACDPTGRLARIVDREYIRDAIVAGVEVLKRRS